MDLKVSFKEKFVGVIEMLTNKNSEVTLSFKSKKKFSDVVEYIRTGKFGKSMAGRVSKDTDSGYMYQYEYFNDGHGMSKGGYKFTISHIGETINELKFYNVGPAAAWGAKSALSKLEKELPDFSETEV